VPSGEILPGLEFVGGVVKLEDGLILIHDLYRLLSLDEETAFVRALGVTWQEAPEALTLRNATLDRALLDEVSGFIAERMGLHFPEERWPDLARGLKTAGEELGFESPDACVRWLRTRKLTTRQIETLASHLTVGETYFFRDPASFEALEREILPPLVAKRSREGRTFRFWSAGCCTGEEAYSLAITCARALPDLKSWNV
jgi:chemotaxis protein methyltransferase CheR